MIISILSLRKAVVGGVLLIVVLFFPNNVLAYNFLDWYHGASGYDEAFQEAIHEEKPLILYFHTEWCKWSKKMNNDYISSYEVGDFLEDILKVEINPDKGAAEKALKKKYGITGFPAFIVLIPSFNGKAERIHPFRKVKDYTIDEFLRAIKNKLTFKYNNKGYSSFKIKEYEEAIKYYEMSIGVDSESVYAYYGKGNVLQTIAYKDKEIELLE